ncbi:MAG: DNA polymerase IV, partial [Pseudomonadota bacterium]
RSAMPMFQALKRCPDAVVLKPRMALYVEVSRLIRARMDALTPLVEPLSLDEAFLDLSGTERLMGAPPALSLVRLAAQIEAELGLTVSVGLSHNKYLAKLASDLDKPRGFAVIGKAETVEFLAPRPVTAIWGVGARLAARLEADGLRTHADLARADPTDLIRRYGSMGPRLARLARGEDSRRVDPGGLPKSLSTETTFDTDIADREALEGHLWRLAVRASDRAKAKGLVGRSITLKLKTARFRAISRQTKLETPANAAEILYDAGSRMLARAVDAGPFRLIGIGFAQLSPAGTGAQPAALLRDSQSDRLAAEAATDEIRMRFGPEAILKGRAWR